MSVAPDTRTVKWSALRVRCPPFSGHRLMVPGRWPYEATPEATIIILYTKGIYRLLKEYLKKSTLDLFKA